jgi:uncharacterized protein (DUF433 family)
VRRDLTLANSLRPLNHKDMKEQLLQRISINPNICFGKPCISGHRIWVSLILDLLANGASVEEVLEDYPGLEREDILACIAYGSEMTRERYVDVPSAA